MEQTIVTLADGHVVGQSERCGGRTKWIVGKASVGESAAAGRD